MQTRQKFVWLRFVFWLLAGVLLLPEVVLCMLVAWLFRMLSRLVSYITQKISGIFYGAFEWCTIKLRFMEEKDPIDDVPPLPVPDAGLEEDLRHSDMINAELPQ